ncbi:MAG: hypothetical protein IJE28_03365 [Oscillospiraceae bacterium]|nr:hypothetical protein [Oscillospiraceae bacterium]
MCDEELMENIEEEQEILISFLKEVDDDKLWEIARALNETYNMPEEDNAIDFMLQLYGAFRLDGFYYSVQDCINEIKEML